MLIGMMDKKKMLASMMGPKEEKPMEREYSEEELYHYAKEGIMAKFIEAVKCDEISKACHYMTKYHDLLHMYDDKKPSDNPGHNSEY